MGARIILCDPHRAVVTGPAQLYGERMESPDIRAGMAMLIAGLCAEGHVDDRQHRPDRPRLRADRRAPARARRAHRARRHLSRPAWSQSGRAPGGASCAHVDVAGRGARERRPPASPCSTTCSRCSPSTRRFDLVARGRPGRGGGGGVGGGPRARRGARERVCAADGCRGYGSAVVPADEALAHVVARGVGPAAASSRTSTSPTRASAGSAHDLVASFLRRARRGSRADVARPAARGRRTPEHVLEAIFKALGVALAQRLPPPAERREECMAEKAVVRTEAAPAPFQGAPYSQAISAGGLVFVSGQLALGPDHTELVGDGDRGADRAGVRQPAGDPRGGRHRARPAREDDGLPRRPRRLRGMNEVYARHVGDRPPARATVEVVGAARRARWSRSRRSRWPAEPSAWSRDGSPGLLPEASVTVAAARVCA